MHADGLRLHVSPSNRGDTQACTQPKYKNPAKNLGNIVLPPNRRFLLYAHYLRAELLWRELGLIRTQLGPDRIQETGLSAFVTAISSPPQGKRLHGHGLNHWLSGRSDYLALSRGRRSKCPARLVLSPQDLR
jgi:hypothetical protein